MDWDRIRDNMVESQVRTNDVTDVAVLRAMRTLPRERFVPVQNRALAYADTEVEAGPGRVLMRPRDLSKLVQALGPKSHERALEIAGATGFGAGVLAMCCKDVVALDPDPELSFAAQSALASCGLSNVKTVSTEAAKGWPDDGPYDVILLNGSTEFVPDAWLQQLTDGGRLGAIVRRGPAGAARIYTRAGDTFAFAVAFDAAPPIAPGLATPPAFSF